MSNRQTRWLRAVRTPLGATAAAMLAIVVFLAVFGPVIWGAQATAIDAAALLKGSSAAHWLGTDNLGRDVFARVLVAGRLSLELSVAATAIAVATGLILGCAPVVLGRRAGRLITAVVNVAVAFPALLLALFFAVIFGVGAQGALLAIGFAGAPTFARLTRTLTASVENLDYVAAARISGVSRIRLVTRHVLPNVGEPLIVNATIALGDVLVSFAGLSFLGLGVQAPTYDWGQMLNDGLNGIYEHPAAALAPGVVVVLASLAFNLAGEALALSLGVPELTAGTLSSLRRAVRHREKLRRAIRHQENLSTPISRTPRGTSLLEVSQLHVEFPGGVHPVRGVSLSIQRGEAVGVVGESGSGKSLTALAIARLLEDPAEVQAELLELDGQDLLVKADKRFLARSLGMVFQDPMTSFNPVKRVGGQLAEAARQQGLTRKDAAARAVERLRAVRIPDPERRYRQFPHELSGGQRQRAMIGMAVMGKPALVIADEPTTALDVTVQRDVLRLLKSIQADEDVALLFISHDITVVGQVCDRVLVMYAGRIVESLPAVGLAEHARHPYTRALLAAVPSMETDTDRPLAVVPGRPADPADLPAGCAFAPRCAFADDKCRTEDPVLVPAGGPDAEGSEVACWHPAVGPIPIAPPVPSASSAPASLGGDQGE